MSLFDETADDLDMEPGSSHKEMAKKHLVVQYYCLTCGESSSHFVVIICIMIGIASKSMSREFNDAVIDGECRELLGKVFLKVAVCKLLSAIA